MGGNFYLYPVLRNSLPQSLNILDHECYSDCVNTRSSTTGIESLKIPTKTDNFKNCHSNILFIKMLENVIWTWLISTINHWQTYWIGYALTESFGFYCPNLLHFYIKYCQRKESVGNYLPYVSEITLFFIFLQTIHLCNDVF